MNSHKNGLPIKFPEGSNARLFPDPWPKRSKGKCCTKLPKGNSEEMLAIMNFFNSYNHAKGDLFKFANYFGVDYTAVSRAVINCKNRLNQQGCADKFLDNTDTGNFLSSFHSIISNWRSQESCCSRYYRDAEFVTIETQNFLLSLSERHTSLAKLLQLNPCNRGAEALGAESSVASGTPGPTSLSFWGLGLGTWEQISAFAKRLIWSPTRLRLRNATHWTM